MPEQHVRKRCSRCKKIKAAPAFYVRKDRKNGSGLTSWCRQCWRDHHADKPVGTSAKQSARWRDRNPERAQELARTASYNRQTRVKLAVIEGYGGACTCCGEDDPHFLTIEHIAAVPECDKRADGRRKPTIAVMDRLIRQGFPDDCTILCFNCNCARGRYGFCPHEDHSDDMRRYPRREGVI